MASGTMQTKNIKTITLSGTTNQYGSFAFTQEAEDVADRITGIVFNSATHICIQIFTSSNKHYLGCYDMRNGGSAYANQPINVKIAYL